MNYVLSKSMSDDDNERDSGGQAAANAFDFGPEWGPARMDRRHQFNGYVLFFLPFHIDLSTSFRALSGRPIDATLGTDTGVGNGDRINTDRPYSAPGVSFERNAFRNESIKDVNLRAQWKFDFNGTKRVILIVRGVQPVQLGQHRAERHAGDQLLRGADCQRLRLRRADQPELPVVDGPESRRRTRRGSSCSTTSPARRGRFSWG